MNVAIVAYYIFNDCNYSVIHVTLKHLYCSVGEKYNHLKKQTSQQ